MKAYKKKKQADYYREHCVLRVECLTVFVFSFVDYLLDGDGDGDVMMFFFC